MPTIKLELNEEKLQEWERIMHECGIPTHKDLINNALVLFGWIIDKIKDGYEIEAINHRKNSCLKPKLPALSAAKPKTPALSVVRKSK